MNRKIKKSTIKLLTIELILIIFFLLNIFVINIDNQYVITLILLMSLFAVYTQVGFEKNRQRLRKDSFMNILVLTISFQMLYFLSGFIFGVLKSGYSLKLINIFKNVFPVALVIISSELLRYSVNHKGKESKLVLALSCILFIVIESSIASSYYNLSNTQKLVEYVCIVLFPAISKNVFLTYNTTTFGYGSSLVYRLIMEIPIYLVPFIPNMSKYLQAVIYLLFPILAFIVSLKTLNPYKTDEVVVSKKELTYEKVGLYVTIVIVLTIITLSSGLFKYYIMAIGSGSMEKVLYRGDAVIVEKLKKAAIKKLKKGDIIVYRYDNKVVVHRIHKIYKANGLRFITKGDNNKDPDNWIVKEEYIIGKTKTKIKYIGYPTVWLNESFNK